MSIFKEEELAKSEGFVAQLEDAKLEKHAWGVYEIVSGLLEQVELKADEKETGLSVGEKENVIKVAAYLHDIGKKSDQFQDILRGEADEYIKHEVKTVDYLPLIKENWEQILGHLDLELKMSSRVLEDILAFAVSHHGLFFLSKVEESQNYKTKRYWTEFIPEETGRITLTDLLFDYHPAGGFIILADLIHSYSLAKGRDDYQEQINELGEEKTIAEFIEEYFAEEKLKQEKEEEKRQVKALKEILKLALGGVKL